MKVYLNTYSNGAAPATSRSLVASKKTAKRNSTATIFSECPDGDFAGYADRSDLYADRHGDAPYLIEVIIRRISDPSTFLANDDQPYSWREAVRREIEQG